MVQKWSKNGPKVVQKWSKNGVRPIDERLDPPGRKTRVYWRGRGSTAVLYRAWSCTRVSRTDLKNQPQKNRSRKIELEKSRSKNRKIDPKTRRTDLETIRTVLSAKNASIRWSRIENSSILGQVGQSGGGPVPEPFGCSCENVKIVENKFESMKIVEKSAARFYRGTLPPPPRKAVRDTLDLDAVWTTLDGVG